MKTWIGAIAAVAVTTTTTAFAADFPQGNYYTAAAPLRTYSWVGPYIGGTAGFEWGKVTNNPTKPSGVAGGLEAGYNWQTGQFVFGGETDINLSGADDTFAPWKFSNPWFGTLRGRAGIALNNVLLFATAGLAYGDLRAETAGLTESNTSLGWTAGLGIEVGFTPNWSAKAEWLYLDLSEHGYSLTGVNNGLQANLLRFGVNYHF
jgi:outer membrane immunogenic protein